ncbi:hypothetical protein E2542_SST21151 [Spatholobus suberectus]|nr:hypothetical protein E2542_SST21151 [Spatholobus suberectus]
MTSIWWTLQGPMHAIFVLVGGDGLIAGIASNVKRVSLQAPISISQNLAKDGQLIFLTAGDIDQLKYLLSRGINPDLESDYVIRFVIRIKLILGTRFEGY